MAKAGFDSFEQFVQARKFLQNLEQHLEGLLAYARSQVIAGTPPRPPASAWAPPAADVPPYQSPPTPSPPARAPAGRQRHPHPHHGFQNPPPPSAPRLPAGPKPTPAQARQTIVRYIESMRAMAVHMHNCAGLLLAIADMLEAALNEMVARASRRP
jgi:hypothetical protein